MAGGANFDLDVTNGRTRQESIAAGTCDSALFVFWMNIGLHLFIPLFFFVKAKKQANLHPSVFE